MSEQNEINLLEEASAEIKYLRKRNEIMSVRLEMFDKVYSLVNTHSLGGQMQECGEDYLQGIDRLVTEKKEGLSVSLQETSQRL